MSTATPSPADRLPLVPLLDRIALAGRVAAPLAEHGRAAAFWTATLLPLAYLPLLAAGDQPTTIAALLTLNALTLLGGHGHDPAA